jgi:hypothetical protein
VWQALRSELHPRGLEVVTVALDTDPQYVKAWIDAASPEHPSLLDRAHVVDELFGFVNVPSSVWIDEEGVIVRPAETANVDVSPAERIERGTLDPSRFTPEMLELILGLRYENELYVAGLRDWVARGADSEWAKSPDEVVERSRVCGDDQARAAAHFELGAELHRRGDAAAAQRHWREAHRLDDANWTYKRQAWSLVSPDQGPSEEYEGDFLRDVQRTGVENFYPPLAP